MVIEKLEGLNWERGIGEFQPDDGSAKLKSFCMSTNQCASFLTLGSTRYSFAFPSLVFPIN